MSDEVGLPFDQVGIVEVLVRLENRQARHAAMRGNWSPMIALLRSDKRLSKDNRAALSDRLETGFGCSKIKIDRRKIKDEEKEKRDADILNWYIAARNSGMKKSDAVKYASDQADEHYSIRREETVWELLREESWLDARFSTDDL